MKNRNKILCLVFLILFVLVKSKVYAKDMGSEVHFLDTAQSDCILIKSENHNLLIDTGSKDTIDNTIKYLKNLGVNKIEYVFITHYHDDHYGGLQKLIDNIEVKTVLLPYHKNIMNYYLFTMVFAKGVDVKYIDNNWNYNQGDIKLKVYHPLEYDEIIENNNCVVIYGAIDKLKYVFSADAEKEEEAELVKIKELKNCDILKVPHHGLDTSSSRKYVKYTSPKNAIITCDGVESPSKNIVKSYQIKNIEIFRTDVNGCIYVKNGNIHTNK